MRRRAKVDGNHAEIVDAFRKAGCSVVSLAPIGGGVPDLIVGSDGYNVMVEVKQPKGQRNLLQRQFDHEWNGWIEVIRSTDEAMALVARLRQ